MVKIRLSRKGSKHKPVWRIVVIDSHKKREGEILDILGFVDPKTNPPTLMINRGRLDDWLKTGAQVSPSAKNIIQKS